MSELGEEVMKPFLQDVMQAGGMARTLAKQIATDPGFVPSEWDERSDLIHCFYLL